MIHPIGDIEREKWRKRNSIHSTLASNPLRFRRTKEIYTWKLKKKGLHSFNLKRTNESSHTHTQKKTLNFLFQEKKWGKYQWDRGVQGGKVMRKEFIVLKKWLQSQSDTGIQQIRTALYQLARKNSNTQTPVRADQELRFKNDLKTIFLHPLAFYFKDTTGHVFFVFFYTTQRLFTIPARCLCETREEEDVITYTISLFPFLVLGNSRSHWPRCISVWKRAWLTLFRLQSYRKC